MIMKQDNNKNSLRHILLQKERDFSLRYNLILWITTFILFLGGITTDASSFSKNDMIFQRLSMVKTPWPSAIYTVSKGVVFEAGTFLPEQIDYTILDWERRIVASGIWKKAKPLKLTTLSPGYYALIISNHGKVIDQGIFGVVADPAPLNQNGYFAAGCSLVYTQRELDGKPIPLSALAEIISLSGCSWYRDYVCWSSVNSKPDVFNWKYFERSVDELKKHNLQLDIFSHSAPDHARNSGATENVLGFPHKSYRMMPDDLLKYFHFNRKMAIHFKGKVDTFEVWNEQDNLEYNSKTAWDFASLQKTAYLGLKNGNATAKVLHGAFCMLEIPEITQICFKNDIQPYFDISNWHIYAELKDYRKVLKKIIALQAKYGFEDKPLWVTENGFSSASAGKGNGPSFTSIGKTAMLEFDAEQDRAFAEFVVKSPLLLQSLGVDKDFIFRILPYNEGAGERVWGMLRWNFTVKPAFIAYSNMIAQVGNAKYQGSCNLGNDIVAFVYKQPDSSQTLVFWKESPLEKFNKPNMKLYRNPESSRYNLKLSSSSHMVLVDLMGHQIIPKTSNGQVELNTGWEPQYLHGLHDISFEEPMKRREKTIQPWNDYDLSVVLKADFSESQLLNTNSVVLNNRERFSVTIYNFGDKTIRGKLEKQCNFKLDGLNNELKIEPMGSRKIMVTLAGGKDQSIIIGGCFNGKMITRLYIPVWLNLPDDYTLVKIDTNNASKWKDNTSGTTQVSYDHATGADLVKTTFKPGSSRWVYPILPLEQVYKRDISNIAAIAFDIRGTNESKVSAAHVMLDSLWLPFRFKGTKWHRIVVPIPSSNIMELKAAKELRIGLNPNSDVYQYYIKNITIYEKRKATP